MCVVGPGGDELVFPIILIISACLKSLHYSLVRARRSSAQSLKNICHFCTHPGCEHSDLVHGAELESTSHTICSELTVVMDPVQDVTEISTDISKVVIPMYFIHFEKICSLLHP